MAAIITTGVDYAQFIDDIRAIIRQEVAAASSAASASTPEVGGIALAQEVTRLSKNTIYSLVSKRGIPHSKRGNKLYFDRAELLAWVAQGNREVAQTGGGSRG